MENTKKIIDDDNDNERKNKRNKPNLFSKLFIWWVCPVLIKGNKRDVEEEDLIVPTKKYDSDRLGAYLERYWLEEYERAISENRKPSLWRAMCRGYWLAYMPSAFYVTIVAIISSADPQELEKFWESVREILDLAEGNERLIMCGDLNGWVGTKRDGLEAVLGPYGDKRLLRVNQVALGDIAGGKLVNLLSNDVARFDYSFMFLHYLWLVPIQAVVVLYLLYEAAGYAPFIGLFSVITIILPVQAGLTKLTAIMRRETAQRTDKRIKLMSEIVNGIKIIKMYAWEKPFQIVVNAARAYEMNALRKALFVRSVFMGFMLITERSVLFVTCLSIVLTGSMLTATLIYPINQYFSLIQINLTLILPLAISSLSEMFVSLERIQNFLCLGYSSNNGPVNEFAIELSNVNACWNDSEELSTMTLKNISMRVEKGELCAIVGSVGSGKTSILQVLLKELPVLNGKLTVNGRISYACQESWLFPATVRENILFGLPYEPARYKEICNVCSLFPDFTQFPYGDLSLVGERGVSLSGGQRARINLARAIYREADIYLLDDPLSAVDANVGRQLFERCIKGYLREKTCILVTHQIHYLKTANTIIVMNEGIIENMGTYDELIKLGNEFSKFLSNQEEDSTTEEKKKRTSLTRTISKMSTLSGQNTGNEKVQVLKAEERAKGNLKWEVLFKYFSSVQSWCIVFLSILTLIITQGAATTADYWLSFWTNQVDEYEQSLPAGQGPDPSLGTQVGLLTTAQYLWIYGSVILGLIIISHVRIGYFVVMTMRASQNLHNTIYKKLIVGLMRFFDTNPSGRVLNRFSKDMGAMDEFLPRSLLDTIQMYFSMSSVLILNAIALPWTLIPTIILLILFVTLLKWYLNAAQAVKRLEGTTKSPVFGMINSTLTGLSTIRSSNSQNRLIGVFDGAQDLHSSAFYTFVGGSTAFALYLDALCLVYLGIIIGIFLWVDISSVIPVGSVALAVSQSMVLTMKLQMAARFTADFLAQMTAVERVLEYTQVPTEENMEHGPTTPPKEWPTEGHIKFENVFLNYGPEDPPVLKNLNFEINSSWKVGVVGRTGAGKSSLISALFRLYSVQGSIKIDDIDCNHISKKELRSKISIIPQEPVLFSATIRYNLDPFNNYSDDDIWRALEQVEMKEAIPALDYKVAEGGNNFSMGQRQLICLARAILRSNKILIMDEATANVDPQTDALIQKTIRREFANCTVITIAHRLNTVMDSDRILVMSGGNAMEFDEPYRLLLNPNTLFSFMVKETGESMSKILFEVAKDKYFNNKPPN
ncbi:hypothetical protein K1T71_003263 [Dendrolimus kikuchii]|uniref:Uncharacterized protein n=1 Tax=Dendrolimus kikuchii TaxID=765133 RepID=A0ACC1DB37_9NEOP|nr:hypothetical protein K1T71_003263 [Dendrolimus kikuchii]